MYSLFTSYAVDGITENCGEKVIKVEEASRIANLVAVSSELTSVKTEEGWVREIWILSVTNDELMTDSMTREDGITEGTWLGKPTCM